MKNELQQKKCILRGYKDELQGKFAVFPAIVCFFRKRRNAVTWENRLFCKKQSAVFGALYGARHFIGIL